MIEVFHQNFTGISDPKQVIEADSITSWFDHNHFIMKQSKYTAIYNLRNKS